MSRTTAQVVVAVVVLVFTVGIAMTGGDPQPAWLRFFGIAVAAVLLVLATYDRYLWRTSVFQRSSKVPRDLRGTWSGTLSSHWVDPETNERIAPKAAYLTIRQTSSTTTVSLFTDESRSKSTLATVTLDEESSLIYMYLNRPDLSVEHRSKMHHGSTSLDITGSPAKRLKGKYWTDRDSKGELDFRDRHSSEYATDYEDAEGLFS